MTDGIRVAGRPSEEEIAAVVAAVTAARSSGRPEQRSYERWRQSRRLALRRTSRSVAGR
jgi:hypothetical protein